MTSVTPMVMKKRQDGVTDGGYPDDIVANAPADRGPFLRGAEGGGVGSVIPAQRQRRPEDRAIQSLPDDPGSLPQRPG